MPRVLDWDRVSTCSRMALAWMDLGGFGLGSGDGTLPSTLEPKCLMPRPRRTFAIISHPDAGKTTLTEKLLLYAGAINEAGAVKARAGRQKDAKSDWMELERERGISISTTVLQFEHEGYVFNLLDTPGHRDFSEDTYRVLSAVDAAIIVIDAAKGIESQTLKLFEVARRRRVPLITFVNKCDRPGLAPLELIDDLEAQLGLIATPMTWPIGLGPDFVGVIDVRDGGIWEFERSARGAKKATEIKVESLDVLGRVGEEASGELELLLGVGAAHNTERFLEGETTPVFFGSALWNFGIQQVLDAVAEMAPPPSAREDKDGFEIPIDGEFSGFVFKIQANLDPRHRDRIAFIRVCSGVFERGAQLVNGRTGRGFSAKYAHQMFGRERDTVETAYPGDIVGLINAMDLAVGDTLSVSGKIAYPAIPTFAPEHFRQAYNMDTSRFKQFRRGMAELDEEGVVQVLRHPERGEQQPILAAVGPLQYDVAFHRLEHEYGASVDLQPTPYSIARRTDPEGAETLRGVRGAEVLTRADGTLMALFQSVHRLDAVQRDHPDLLLDTIVVR